MSPVRTPAPRALRTALTMSCSAELPANRRSIRPSAELTPRSSASPSSNSDSSMRPSSKANSSSRACSFPRKAPASASGFSPSLSQKALKEASRLVVITPPQSISRPRRGSASIGHRLGLAGELEHAVAELLQVGVVRGAGDSALVVALHEHDRLPHGERRVPAQVLHRAPRALLVALDQLGTGGE